MPLIIVVVINESLAAVEPYLVFLMVDVNILVFFLYPKSFDPTLTL